MKQCEKGHFFDDARHSTCPYCVSAPPVFSAGAGKTVAADAAAQPGPGRTVAVSQPAAPADAGRTVGLLQKKVGVNPPVGFLVCVSGPQKGADYRLCSGRNFIGRAAYMDVSLPDDETVSRENHAILSYDERSNSFTLAPGSGRGITYCNGKQVEAPQKLNAYDVIELGASSLLFLPLCCERFTWA